MAVAIKKILLKKGTNAAGKAGLGLIFDGRDNKMLGCDLNLLLSNLLNKVCVMGHMVEVSIGIIDSQSIHWGIIVLSMELMVIRR